ncbi:hypothetical protein Cpir12675_003446 [Ceratocystis pirilliformis]|uniref:Uncharacterized protein n=1 Tax=Ceratocystis pirilliformis TaxID=259994 RepID=A0ABR3Z426_9PEZI
MMHLIQPVSSNRLSGMHLVTSAVAEPQPQYSRWKDESSNSSAPVPAVIDRIKNAPSHRKRGAKSRARCHNLTTRTPLAQFATQLPRIEIPDVDGFINHPAEERY